MAYEANNFRLPRRKLQHLEAGNWTAFSATVLNVLNPENADKTVSLFEYDFFKF